MGAQIYKAPSTIKKPEYDFGNYKAWKAEEERYIEDVTDYCKENGSGDLKGKQISIPMADSAAYYMIFSVRPLELIHMELVDCWDSEWAELLTEAKVREMVKSNEAMAKLFGG